MMLVPSGFRELRNIEMPGKLVKMKHGVVFTVFAKESDVFAKVHVFEVIGYKAAVTSLYTLAEFTKNCVVCGRFHNLKLDFSIKVF